MSGNLPIPLQIETMKPSRKLKIAIVLSISILINVFLAILGEAYSMVREKMEEEEEERKKAEKGRRKRTFGEWLKMLRAVWKARKAKQAKAKAAGG